MDLFWETKIQTYTKQRIRFYVIWYLRVQVEQGKTKYSDVVVGIDLF